MSKLLARTAIGLLLGVAVFFATQMPRPVIAALVAVWSVLATVEFVALLRRADVVLDRWLLPALNAAVVAAAYFGLLPGFLIAPVAVLFLAAVAAQDPRPRTPVYGLFVIFYLGFAPAHLVMLKNIAVERALSGWLVFFPLALTWLNDTAAYFVGRLIGRHRLAPTISPNKTVEGYVAGLVASAVFTALFLSRAASRTLYGKELRLKPSRFLAALPEGLFARSTIVAKHSRKEKQLSLLGR